MSDFNHMNEKGQPHMVDTSAKVENKRTAKACCDVALGEKIMASLEGDELQSKKGPVFQTAIIAGIMAAKNTAQLIPMCHSIPLSHCNINIQPIDKQSIRITSLVKTKAQTGVEMEALTACSVAALTVYDMCKALSKDIVISQTQLLEKTGGKSGNYSRSS